MSARQNERQKKGPGAQKEPGHEGNKAVRMPGRPARSFVPYLSDMNQVLPRSSGGICMRSLSLS